jgi:hypothetical protein
MTDWPVWTADTPSFFVIDRSAVTMIVSVSVALSLPATGSVTDAGAVTVAVFDSVPVAAGLSVPVAVYVTVPPGGSTTVRLIKVSPLMIDQQRRRPSPRRSS